MDLDTFRTTQGPYKDLYASDADAAMLTLKARGVADAAAVTCKVETGRGLALAGIHPKVGGSGAELCSGDMLLEALIACAGVSMRAAAAVLEIPIRSVVVTAEGDVDLRGTLGVTVDVPVGFKDIRLAFDIDTDASEEALEPAGGTHRQILRDLPDHPEQPEDQRADASHAVLNPIMRRRVSARRRMARVSVASNLLTKHDFGHCRFASPHAGRPHHVTAFCRIADVVCAAHKAFGRQAAHFRGGAERNASDSVVFQMLIWLLEQPGLRRRHAASVTRPARPS